jgi:hypothetical protein
MKAQRLAQRLAALHQDAVGPAAGAPEYLQPADLVRRWDSAVAAGTLANWRTRQSGPPFIKLGGQVLYPIGDLVQWERAQLQPKGTANG